MAGWPAHIAWALKELGNQYPGDVLSVEVLASFWGGLDDINLLHAAQEGEGDQDTILAILALASTDSPAFRDVLISLLESPFVPVRWISAYCLGKVRDEHALPALHTIVATGSPAYGPDTTDEENAYFDWLYENWYPRIVRLWHEWEEEQ